MVTRYDKAANFGRALQAFEVRRNASRDSSIKSLLEAERFRKTSFDKYFPVYIVIDNIWVNDVIAGLKSQGRISEDGLEEAAIRRAYRTTVTELKRTYRKNTLDQNKFNDIIKSIDDFVDEFNSSFDNTRTDIQVGSVAQTFNFSTLNQKFNKIQEKFGGGENFYIVSRAAAPKPDTPSISLIVQKFESIRNIINPILNKNLKIALKKLEADLKTVEKFGITESDISGNINSALTNTLVQWGHTTTEIKEVLANGQVTSSKFLATAKIVAAAGSIPLPFGSTRLQPQTLAQEIFQDFLVDTGQINTSIDLTQAAPGSLDLQIASSGVFQSVRPQSSTQNRQIAPSEARWKLQSLLEKSTDTTNALYAVLGGSNNTATQEQKQRFIIGKCINLKASPSLVDNLIIQATNPLFDKKDQTKFKPSKTNLLNNSRTTVARIKSTAKLKPKKLKTAKSTPLSAKTEQRSIIDLSRLVLQINSNLHDQIRSNMGTGSRRDVLNYRSGRFARSAKVERLSESRQGMITAFYSYMKNPYATFSRGGLQERPYTRDPKLLISKSIRELAGPLVSNRMRAVLV